MADAAPENAESRPCGRFMISVAFDRHGGKLSNSPADPTTRAGAGGENRIQGG
jgi:hypothetical protein